MRGRGRSYEVGVQSLWGDPESSITVAPPARIRKARPKRVPTDASKLAARVVATYSRIRRGYGYEIPAGDWKKELGAAVHRIAASGRWKEDTLLFAASDFATTPTKRRPAFFIEWVRARWAMEERARHEAMKEQLALPVTNAAVQRILAGFHFKRVALPASQIAKFQNGAGDLRKGRCPRCGNVIWYGEGSTPHHCGT